ncbi:MAG: hypothetical protein C0522_11320 [Rhodocyclaceae bacterium]|nr:hypothetical protein [Rhodocyclaceae bacterium]
MSPAAASIIKAAPYVTGGDPLAELIAEYRAQVACFNARAKDEDWDTLLAATYGPPLERLWHNPPEPTTAAGVAAGIRLAMAEPELYAVPQILAACLRHLERGNAS